MDYFVQDSLKQGGADPQVLDGQWGQVGQLWQLPHILLQALDLISPLRPERRENTVRKEVRTRTLLTPGVRMRGEDEDEVGSDGAVG